LQAEFWQVRGAVRHTVVKTVSSATSGYKLHDGVDGSEDELDYADREKKIQKKINKKVERLLKNNRFINRKSSKVCRMSCALSSVGEQFLFQGSKIYFGNKVIEQLIIQHLFPSDRSFGTMHADNFNPMPLPTIALACTAVSQS